ncbi:hypothetical protein RJ641_018995 [Dillenia turbinata]|uniref:Uncharacterized protein n=1 Tax=Dillenia turbinata TaxID=194707 RepID=A0AAN8UL88_9MAGN
MKFLNLGPEKRLKEAVEIVHDFAWKTVANRSPYGEKTAWNSSLKDGSKMARPRLCVDKKFAYTQMKMVAASILLRYSIEVVEGWNVLPKITATLYMKNGLMVTFKPRLASR